MLSLQFLYSVFLFDHGVSVVIQTMPMTFRLHHMLQWQIEVTARTFTENVLKFTELTVSFSLVAASFCTFYALLAILKTNIKQMYQPDVYANQ